MNSAFFFLARVPAALQRRLGSAISTFVHRRTLDRVGPNTRFHSGCRLFFPGTAHIGADCHFDCDIQAGADVSGSHLEIGDNVQINRMCRLDISADLTIGDNVLISEEAVIYTHSHGLDPRSAPRMTAKRIGKDVWIGRRAIVMASCADIGEGAVIGAGTIVTRNVAPYEIVAGIPGRVIGKRDPNEPPLSKTAAEPG